MIEIEAFVAQNIKNDFEGDFVVSGAASTLINLICGVVMSPDK